MNQLPSKKNFWGQAIPSTNELFANRIFAEHINYELVNLFLKLDNQCDARSLAEEVVFLAGSRQYEPEYEYLAHQLLVDTGLIQKHHQEVKSLSQRKYDLFMPYVVGNRVMDFGCGDGLLGRRFADNCYDVTLADVCRNSLVDESNLPFVYFTQGETMPLEDEQFDAILIYGVLHHSDAPIASIKDLIRLIRPNGRLITVETVYGINETELSKVQREEAKPMLAFDELGQFHHTMFFDHFANRIFTHFAEDPLHKINVPYNFNKLEEWNRIFEELQTKVIASKHLGVNEVSSPLYHTLHVCEKTW